MTRDKLVHIKQINLEQEIKEDYIERLRSKDANHAANLKEQLSSNEYASYMLKDKSKLKF